MKRYSPGASIKTDYCYICDNCKKEDGRPVLIWETLPEHKGHFALCAECLTKLYNSYVINDQYLKTKPYYEEPD